MCKYVYTKIDQNNLFISMVNWVIILFKRTFEALSVILEKLQKEPENSIISES